VKEEGRGKRMPPVPLPLNEIPTGGGRLKDPKFM